MSLLKKIVNSIAISLIVFFSLVYLMEGGILIAPQLMDWKVFLSISAYVFTALILIE
ncbi:MAG: hypothetical protein AB1467_06000 [Candidatus Diapherotrites archaeon]